MDRARRYSFIVCLWVLLAPITYVGNARSDMPPGSDSATIALDKVARARSVRAYGKLPLRFEVNAGQASPNVKFLSRGHGYIVLITTTGAVFSLDPFAPVIPLYKSKATQASGFATTKKPNGMTLQMHLTGTNAETRVVGVHPLSGKHHYFIGNDPRHWYPNIPLYAKVWHQNVYPGIDIVYYGNQQQLEYDFLVAPSADPQSITLSFKGADTLELVPQGDLVIGIQGERLQFRRPAIYQKVAGVRKEVAGSYIRRGPNQIGFAIGPYDRSRPLIIDPILTYATFLGGNRPDDRAANDGGEAIALDTEGNIYVTGVTNSTDFPILNPVQAEYQSLRCSIGSFSGAPCSDAFVTKLTPAGDALVYSTYLVLQRDFAIHP